jgi:hypothetical protein
MIFDSQRPRGQNPALIILHAKIHTDDRTSSNPDDVTLGDRRLVLKLPLIFCNPFTPISCMLFFVHVHPKQWESLPVTFPIWSG